MLSEVYELWSFRSLVGNLAQRELRSKYKKSVLGWSWSLINPAATLLIYSLVFGTFLAIKPPVAGNGSTQVFALYLFAALIVWNFFNAVVVGSMSALSGAGPLIKKVYFPPEATVLANALTALLQTGIETIVLVAVMIVLGNVSWTFLIFFYLLAMMVLFCVGIGLMASISNAYFRDVSYIIAISLNLLFYATPIIYPLSVVPKELHGIPIRAIISANPLTQFVQASRDCFYLLKVPSAGSLLWITTSSVIMFIVGWVVFQRHASEVTEEL